MRGATRNHVPHCSLLTTLLNQLLSSKGYLKVFKLLVNLKANIAGLKKTYHCSIRGHDGIE